MYKLISGLYFHLKGAFRYLLSQILVEQDFESSSSTFCIHNMTLKLNLGNLLLVVVRGPSILCTTKKMMPVKLYRTLIARGISISEMLKY